MIAATEVPIFRGRVNRHSTARHVTVASPLQDVERFFEAALAHHLGAISHSFIFSRSLQVVAEGGHVDVDFEVVPASELEELLMLELSISLEALHAAWGLPDYFDLLHLASGKP